jgi:hypothetical protein
MRQLTQTVTASANNDWVGNCWQTAIACLLDIDPDVMPPQEKYDRQLRGPDGVFTDIKPREMYSRVLAAYLRDHHGLAYLEMHSPPELFPMLRVADPRWHLMAGKTIRSETMGGMTHVCVALQGKVVWDTHPSRAGLLPGARWALLVPFPKSWAEMYNGPCICPSCAKAIPHEGNSPRGAP